MSEFDDLMKQKAVALKYNPDKNNAPIIVASGMGYMAERITETALEAGVPVYEDDSLATLLTQLKLGAEIPRELYQAIVEIYIYFLGYVPGAQEQQEEVPAGGPDGENPAEKSEEDAGAPPSEPQNRAAGGEAGTESLRSAPTR